MLAVLMLPMLAEETVAKTEEESFGSKLMPPPLPFALVRPIDSIKYFYRHLWYFTQPISFLLFHPAHDPPTPFKPRKSISAGSCPDMMQHFQLAEAQIHSDQGIPFQAAGARCSVTRPAIDAKLRHLFFPSSINPLYNRGQTSVKWDDRDSNPNSLPDG